MTNNIKSTKDESTVHYSVEINNLLKRMFDFLNDKDFDKADEYAEKILDIKMECPEAYLGKLMAELNVTEKDSLALLDSPIYDNLYYKKAMRYGKESIGVELEKYNATICNHIYERAQKFCENEEYSKAIEEFEKIPNYKDSQELLQNTRLKKIDWLKKIRENLKMADDMFDADDTFVAIKTDGSLLTTMNQEKPYGWENLVFIAKSDGNIAGITSDGKCLSNKFDLSDWTDMVKIAIGNASIIGLTKDGKVKYKLSSYSIGNCEDFRFLESLENIVDIDNQDFQGTSFVALKSDGTVVAFGNNSWNRCKVGDWTDIVQISIGNSQTVGLKNDGTVVVSSEIDRYDVSEWKDIVSIKAKGTHIAGLKADGTVLIKAFSNFIGSNNKEIDTWENVVGISTSGTTTTGITADGKILYIGYGQEGRKDKYKKIKLFENYYNLEQERKIALSKKREAEKREAEKREAEKREAEERERKRLIQMQTWRKEKRCQYCGGKFKGLFAKTCSNCGKKKDY